MVSKTNKLLRESFDDATHRENAAILLALREAEPGAEAVQSPARQLQIELEQTWASEAPRTWSPRRAAVFIICTNLVLWAALVAATRMIS